MFTEIFKTQGFCGDFFFLYFEVLTLAFFPKICVFMVYRLKDNSIFVTVISVKRKKYC